MRILAAKPIVELQEIDKNQRTATDVQVYNTWEVQKNISF